MRNGRRGMTLIEVMIAVTLVSLLAIGMLFAIRVGLTTMEATNRRSNLNRRALGAQRILSAEVAGFLPVIARCGGSAVVEGGSNAPFFEGLPAVMRFASTYSLEGASRGAPQVAEFFVAPGQAGQGVRLLLNELPYTGPIGAGFLCQPPAPDPVTGVNTIRFAPPAANPRSFVVADRLASVHFLYLQSDDRDPDLWVPAWTKQDQWPAAVRIEMVPLEPDASRVQPMTFTGRFRPNRRPGEQFEY
ncbi:prepilin-type N-terminal cleavage/methylation domain-containing protein [uncultured Paludibaculum sp.]|uniref:PulJ/GspJ family protein n=1 Tax=uncultured Paludibaculum sp. TaxID=1765020 RepID=UPI002AAAEB0F|nr:prepilin-type N-terminal cleavage/methylation domain-containing protein [uncultured Paludibaculum sp.]